MAHFAQIDETNTVIQVIVISNADIIDENGQESEEMGIDLCRQIVDANAKWVQTSYNNNFRKLYAQPGLKYVPEKDLFYDPVGPYPSWSLNLENYDWEPPIPVPQEGEWIWDEQNLNWIDATEMIAEKKTDA